MRFDTSSTLAIGAIAGCIAPALIAVLHVGCLLYKFCKREPIEEDHGKIAIFLGMAIPTRTMFGAVINSSVISVLPNPVVTMIILVSAIARIITIIMGVYLATSLVHCADEAAITFAASATLITDSTYVEISQKKKWMSVLPFLQLKKFLL